MQEPSTSGIIYEVNLSVPQANADGYLQYLEDFTKEMIETIPGFSAAHVFNQPKPVGLHWLSEEEKPKTYLVVHYYIDKEESLDAYLRDHQEGVSIKDQERWGFLVTSRRILRLKFSSVKQ
ncbi:hypothetical protein HDU67_003510 [Dinochytrium kinnereticum]|nr:hypothetical protein HDU67_003510 [Dinochytrium kinnereticum]